MSDTTEHDILSNIPDLDDNTPDTSNDTADTTTQETEGATTTDTATSVEGTGSEGSTSNTPTQPAAIVRKDGLLEKPSASNPGARDLVDPNTGLVVARGGIERRIFEGAQKVHRENTQLQQRVTQAEANANHANEVVRLGTSLNLQPADQSAALNIMARFLKDPVKTLEEMVVEVKSKGYEIPFLATGVTPGMDTAAVQRMLDQRMAPITQQRQQQEQVAQHQANAKVVLDTFLDQNPEGTHNLTVLAEMMTASPGLTIQDAYVKMIKWAASNGLDYSQPLKQQIEQRRQQPPANTVQTPTATQPRSPTAPLPNARPVNGAVPVEQAATFNENSSWADIIRQSMKESGMSA